jgi:hypothetical protein
LFLEAFPWQHTIDIRIKNGRLNPEDTIVLTYGDQRQGGPGAQIQPFEERAYAFRFYVAIDAEAAPLPVAQDVTVRIVGGEMERLSLVGPSVAAPRETATFTIRAEDRYGNLATGFTGQLKLEDSLGHCL